jgi:IS5 family transposase
MENIVDFALEERYKSIKQRGDRLDEFSTLIEWDLFRDVVGDIYQNRTEQGGRPNMDIVLMVKLLGSSQCIISLIRHWNGRPTIGYRL